MAIEAAFFGTLGRDATEKISGTGKSYLRLSIRVGDGETAAWVSVTAFDKNALASAAKFIKGARVYCEGTLRLNEWTGADGEQRRGLSVMSWHCRLAQIGRNRERKRKETSPAPQIAAGEGAPFDDPLPQWTP